MKKNRTESTTRPAQSYTIRDYGHNRAIDSLARGSKDARVLRRKRQRNLLGGLILLAILAVVAWQIWPGLPGRSGQTSSTAPTGASQTSGSATELTTASLTSQETAGSSAAETTAENITETSGEATSAEPTTSEPAVTLSSEARRELLAAAAEQVTSLLAGKPGRFGVYFRNLQTGEEWKYKDDQPFVAASSIKLGINTYLYTQIASGKISPDEVLSYDSRAYPTGDYEAGTGTIQNQPNGTKYTVRETSGLSIRISDNCGTNMVIRRLGGIDAINPFLNEISGVVDYRKPVSYKNYAGQASSGRHRTCALDLGRHAVKLYQLWLADPATYQPLLDDLSQTEFDFGIQKGIPAGVQVAHKIGTNGTYSAENDVGIVFADEPFVLCVMTEMASAAKARQIQADIAAILYDYITALD